METEKLYIKNMVCDRCKMVVRSELEKLGITVLNVDLGEVTLSSPLSDLQKIQIQKTLAPIGFEIIEDKRSRLIEQIKTLIIELVHYNDNDLKINLSDYLSEKLHHDYNYISNLFSEIEGSTIEKYFIAQKIEKVKELLVYDELTLNEIAFRLNYSSTAHLSSQFKKITGLAPSHFKTIKTNKRNPLDKV